MRLANNQLKTAASLLAIQRYAAQAHHLDHVVVSFRDVTQRSPFFGGMLRDIPKMNSAQLKIQLIPGFPFSANPSRLAQQCFNIRIPHTLSEHIMETFKRSKIPILFPYLDGTT